MKNPKWHRDEIILALDLYFNPDRGSVDARNPNIIKLSQELNLLPLFNHKPDEARFRNPNGVSLKLSNFLAIDPSYAGKGMEAFSKLDKALFEEFANDRDRLHTIAQQIRTVLRPIPGPGYIRGTVRARASRAPAPCGRRPPYPSRGEKKLLR